MTDISVIVAVIDFVIGVKVEEGSVCLAHDSGGEDLVERKDAKRRSSLDVEEVNPVRV